MKVLRILLLLVVCVTARAQTNEVRQVSLQDCIELALKHNLDLQIERYNPDISLYNLKANYGAYDPTLSLSGQHSHSESGSQLIAGGFQVPGSVSDSDSFSSILSGFLPSGTTYTLGTLSPFNDTYGNSGTAATDFTQPPTLSTNSVFDIAHNQELQLLQTNYPVVPARKDFENSSGQVGISLAQPLLKNFWIDATRLNIRVAKNRLKYSEYALKLQIMQTVTLLEQAYFELIYSRENLIVQQKAVELAERLVAENKKRLEVGALAPLDLQSAEAQAASARAAVIAAKSQLDTQERVVKALITDQYRDWSNVELQPAGKLTAVRPILNLQDSWSRALSERPDIIQARLDVEKQNFQLQYDRNQLLPDLQAFGTYGYNGSGGKEFSDAFYKVQQRDQPFYTWGGRVSFPLWNGRARYAYKTDKATMQQVVLRQKQLEQQTMILIDNDVGTIRANYDQVQATRTAREYQEAALDAEQKKLASGKSTTYNVLLVQRDLTAARGNEILALDNFNKSLSQLSLHESSTLERLGISFEVK